MPPTFEHRHAAHCESGVTASLLRHGGLDLSEPLIFGLGCGLHFFYVPFVKIVGMPLVSFRSYPGTIFKKSCKRLGVRAYQRSFLKPERGVRALDELLERGIPVGLQANMFWLQYFPREFRSQFNGHNLIALARRGDEYEVSDPVLQEPMRCPADMLERARFAKGMLAPRGLIFYPLAIDPPADLGPGIDAAIRENARKMLTPMPLAGVKGIRTLSKHVRAWPRKHAGTRRPLLLLAHVIRLQEEVGTGGAGFRFMYAAFLQEAGERLDHAPWREASERMTAVGDLWRSFAIVCGRILKGRIQAGESFDMAADRLAECADAEASLFRFLLANPRPAGARTTVAPGRANAAGAPAATP